MEQFATEAEVMRAAADRTDDTNADVNDRYPVPAGG